MIVTGGSSVSKCPKWVINVSRADIRSLPLFPHNRTCTRKGERSQKCQEETSSRSPAGQWRDPGKTLARRSNSAQSDPGAAAVDGELDAQ